MVAEAVMCWKALEGPVPTDLWTMVVREADQRQDRAVDQARKRPPILAVDQEVKPHQAPEAPKDRKLLQSRTAG